MTREERRRLSARARNNPRHSRMFKREPSEPVEPPTSPETSSSDRSSTQVELPEGLKRLEEQLAKIGFRRAAPTRQFTVVQSPQRKAPSSPETSTPDE